MPRYDERPSLAKHLPKQLTPLVDRETELQAVTNLLADPECRLLTIVGPGGIGKTRLAIAAAAGQWRRVEEEADEAFVHGIFFVALQSLQAVEMLAPTIADAIGCPPANHELPQRQLFNYASNKAMLIVLDSVDELLAAVQGRDDCLDLLTALLEAAPYVKLLVTSREALNLQEEWLYPLGGLAYPRPPQPGEADPTPADLAGYGAIQLFTHAARRARPDFTLAQEWQDVTRICRLVEGLPLALELAAAWVRVLDCAAIANEIERSIDFLATNLRNAPERHRSMYAVFTQTWQMLSEEERNVFQRLAVFRNGFRRRAAEAVAGASLPVLSSLVGKSLLRWDANGRYHLHSLLRHYAAERLNEDPALADAAVDAHAGYFARFLHRRTTEIHGHRQHEVLLEINAELENIRSAWRRAAQHGRIEWLGEATYTLYQFYDMQGRYQEGVDASEQALAAVAVAAPSPVATQAEALLLTMQGWNGIRLGRFDESAQMLHKSRRLWTTLALQPPAGFGTDPALGLALLATVQGDYPAAIALADEACARHSAAADWLNVQIARYTLASALFAQGNYEASRGHAQEGYRLTKAGGNRWMLSNMLNLLGEVSRVLGEYEEARQYYQQCYFLREEFNDPEGMAVSQNLLAKTAWLRGDYREAERLYQRSLAIYQCINDPGGLAMTYLGLGESALMQQAYPGAYLHLHEALQRAAAMNWLPLNLTVLVRVAQLLHYTSRTEQAVALLILVGRHPSCNRETREAAAEQASLIERALSPERLAASRLRGELFDLGAATATALAALAVPAASGSFTLAIPARNGAPANQPLVEQLTGREAEVLQLIADGFSNQQIADQLILSVGTVKFYTGQIYGKLGVNSRTQAVALARSLQLLEN